MGVGLQTLQGFPFRIARNKFPFTLRIQNPRSGPKERSLSSSVVLDFSLQFLRFLCDQGASDICAWYLLIFRPAENIIKSVIQEIYLCRENIRGLSSLLVSRPLLVTALICGSMVSINIMCHSMSCRGPFHLSLFLLFDLPHLGSSSHPSDPSDPFHLLSPCLLFYFLWPSFSLIFLHILSLFSQSPGPALPFSS